MNEVSKLGQPEEEPIEGRIVGDYEGPGAVWNFIEMQERERQAAQAYYYSATMQALINGEWTYVYDAPSENITYERGPSYPSTADGWWDEVADFSAKTVTMEFPNVSNELFSALTGYDYEVLRVVQNNPWEEPDTAPEVDPDKVKWPTNGRMSWTRTRRQ